MKLARGFALVLALALIGCATAPPAPTVTPSPAATDTPVPPPTATLPPTSTPIPTPTLTPTPYDTPQPGWIIGVALPQGASLRGAIPAAAEAAAIEGGGAIVFAEVRQDTGSSDRALEALVAKGSAVIYSAFYYPEAFLWDMPEAMARAARAHPDVRFIIGEYLYTPENQCGLGSDGANAKDCYAELLPNVTTIDFASDESAFLAGVAVACAIKLTTIGVVGGPESSVVKRFTKGYIEGAYFVDDAIGALLTFMPDFVDPAGGEAEANKMIGAGKAEAIFVAAGPTGDGALRAAAAAGIPAVASDSDRYLDFPEVRPVLVTSALKRWDVATAQAVRAYARGDLGAIFLANLANGGVDIAPYHDWDAKISDECKVKVEKVRDAIASGKLKTGYEGE